MTPYDLTTSLDDHLRPKSLYQFPLVDSLRTALSSQAFGPCPICIAFVLTMYPSSWERDIVDNFVR